MWAARFFRSRSLAVAAIGNGQVFCDGVRAKPSRQLRVGNMLVIEKAGLSYTVEVRQLAERRGPASRAQQLYVETAQSQAQREIAAAQQRAARLTAPKPPEGKPQKHARAQIRRFIGKD